MAQEASSPATRAPRIGIVAGEASGDLLASHLMREIRRHFPLARFEGVGGPRMLSVGMDALFPMEKLAVRGYVEVLRHYREIVGIRDKLRGHFLRQKPDLFIGVDAPDFNLKLEKSLKRQGVPVVHYVGPSIWAWRAERMGLIRSAVSHMLLLFPFEKALYDKAGVAATYVGHPLADMLPENPDKLGMREQLRLPQDQAVVAFLPGSRQSELKYMGDLFIRVAQIIHGRRPDVRFLVPLVSRETRKQFEDALYAAQAQDLPMTILFGHAHDAMRAADVVLVASGTATLEAALLKKPMVITYKMPSLSWRIMQRKKYQPYVGLPNILAGKFVVPELLQDDATPENLAQAVENLLGDSQVSEGLELHFANLHRQLKQNCSAQAVHAILPLLSGRRP